MPPHDPNALDADMWLRWHQGDVTLEDADDFKHFKIVVDADLARQAEVARGFEGLVEFVDAGTAWVSQAALRAFDGRASNGQWQAGLDAMVAKARPHDWVHATTGAIRAHVVWQPPGAA